MTPVLLLPPVHRLQTLAGRRVLLLLALSQLPSASPPPPVSGTGTATVFRSRGAACTAGAGWALGCCVFLKQYSLGCVGCGTRNLVSLRPGGSLVAPCGISSPDQGWDLCPCTERGVPSPRTAGAVPVGAAAAQRCSRAFARSCRVSRRARPVRGAGVAFTSLGSLGACPQLGHSPGLERTTGPGLLGSFLYSQL